MTDARPLPEPDDTSAFFWDGAREGRLLVQRCDQCEQFQYPPEVVCIHCRSTELTPTEVSGRGRLWTYTVVERVFDAGFSDAVPYALALVELDEQGGLHLLTNVVDVAPEELEIGMPLEVVFEDRGEVVVPQFRPAGAVA
ncbi:MAG: Zn-ribbon domain-containing OB-fold protein [Acidimicrobiia bacterium]